jgi:serine/threonine protein kinase
MSGANESNGWVSAPSSIVAELVDRLTARVQAGQAVDWQEVARQYPEHVAELRRLWPAVGALDELSRSRDAELSGIAATGPGAAGIVDGVLGDFRVLREVGKGGMGIVYEAEQVSLRRRVALKVLPFAATMDPRHLRRFQNEAQAAACLHHTNIVPVYSVGCERGIHFYAMQFIDGQPLSELIRQLSHGPTAREERTTPYPAPPGETPAASPTVRAIGDVTPLTPEGKRGREYFRRVAELGVQVAEALDHAHQFGIVHRDIKPGNLMLDGRGNLWVTDFGLAQVQHGEAHLTLTGDLVGTLRYMSPEQALAKRVVIDHRADVYSLGVTLYELLTLRPAFGGEDRQELLRQIAFEEPARPRRRERAIPVELETIILKAMEKRPQDRYATAQALADDLDRWLKNEPIRARRPTLLQRAIKWGRRHKPVMWAATAVLLVVAVLGGANALWWVQKRAGADGEARAAVEEASRLQQEEKWSEALSAVRRAEGVLAGTWPDPRLRQQIEQLAKDLEMAQRLEEARLRGAALRNTEVFIANDGRIGKSPGTEWILGLMAEKEGNFDWEGAVQAYAAAFLEYGLWVYVLDPQEAGERIRSSSIRMQLVVALDDWAYATQKTGMANWGRLVEVARAADPDPWRGRLRDALEDKDPRAELARAADPDPWRGRLRDALEDKDPQAVEELVASARSDDLPPATAVLLTRLADGTSAAARALTVLRQVRQRHPADFWANHALASYLSRLGPLYQEEALRYHTAAVALRPRSALAHLRLGGCARPEGLAGRSHRRVPRSHSDPERSSRLE